jgi:hypothetical protein
MSLILFFFSPSVTVTLILSYFSHAAPKPWRTAHTHGAGQHRGEASASWDAILLEATTDCSEASRATRGGIEAAIDEFLCSCSFLYGSLLSASLDVSCWSRGRRVFSCRRPPLLISSGGRKEDRGARGKVARNLGAKSRGPHAIKLAVVRAYNAAKLGDLVWEQELRSSFREGTTPSSLGRGRGISTKSPAYSRLIDGRCTCP